MMYCKQYQNIPLVSKHHSKKFGLDAHCKNDGKSKPVVIFIHGFNGFKDWGHFSLLGEFFAENNFVFIRFNLSHNGTTYLRPTEFVDLEAYGNDLFSTDLDDIDLVIDYLHSKECPFKKEMNLDKLFLIGHSRGGALSILGGYEQARVKGIATWASIVSTQHFWTPERLKELKKNGVFYIKNGRTKQTLPLYYAYYEDTVLNAKRLNVENAMKNLNKPALIAHGDNDEAVPFHFLDKLAEWNPKAEKIIVEETGHTFGGKHPYTEKTLPEKVHYLAARTLHFFNQI